MQIKDIKDLQKLIQLCRKTGIEAMEIDNIKFNLGPAPKRASKPVDEGNIFPEASMQVPQFTPSPVSSNVKAYVQEVIKTDELTTEQLLNWSVGNDYTSEGQ